MTNERLEPQLTSYLFAKAAQSHTPICGTFEVTPLCNFNCPMCYVHMTKEQMKDTGRRPLTADQWQDIAAQGRDKGLLYLLLTGGEPFLYPGFRQLYEALADMGFIISINSNGSLIDEETVSWLRRKPPSRINITLYGVTNETYRRLCGDPQGFAKVSAAIDRLRDADIPLKLNCSLIPHNAKELPQIVSFAQERELIVEITPYMFPAHRCSEKNVGQNTRFTPEETARYALEIQRLQTGEDGLRRYAEQILQGSAPSFLEDCAEISADGSIRCRAGRATFWLTWYGMMTPCGMMTGPAVGLLGRSFEEAWQELTEKTAKIRLSGHCARCGSKEICHACAAMAQAETGSFAETPQYLCRMTETLRSLAKELLENNLQLR